ncbi:MAG: CopG family transcriptional regulator [Actinomycetota bacterium]
MKRLQIYIEEDLDARLAVEAGRRRTSKAALIREAVRDRFGRRPHDPIDDLVGLYDEEPGDIDEVVYDGR